jgi:hypothetical protein
MDKTLLSCNTWDYYINNGRTNRVIMIKMIIDHFEGVRKDFLDTNVYNFCISTRVLDSNVISVVDFINAVCSADFKTIYNHAERRKSKSKCKYIIYALSRLITPKDWYSNRASKASR